MMSSGETHMSGGQLHARIETWLRSVNAGPAGLARLLGLPADAVARWLAGDEDAAIAAALERFERSRETLMEQLQAANSGGMRRERAGELSARIDALLDELSAPRGADADTDAMRGELRLLAAELIAIASLPAASTVCWRCKADQNPAPAEVESQIELNLAAAAWAGWPPEVYAEKCRSGMRAGMRIIGIRAGAIVVRGASGDTFEISRWDA